MSIQIFVTTNDDRILPFSVDAKEPVENIKALIEVETGILVSEQVLVLNGAEVLTGKLISDYGVKDGDLFLVDKKAAPQQGGGPSAAPQGDAAWDPATVQRYFRNDPMQMRQLQNNNPRMAEAVMNDDLRPLAALLREEQEKRRRAEMQRILEAAALSADPLDPSAQAKIEEAIRMENVNENMETAIEYNPEAFGRVVMLYIDCEVNHTPVKAFVDSGAQTTIMSMDCAARCGIARLIDSRWAGVARGVGTAKIVGRVHVAQLKIGKSFFSSSFTILQDNQGTDLLLGLDMLKKHQCVLDLRENVLRIGDEAAPFLSEKDIPRNIRFEEMPMDEEPTSAPSLPRPSTTTTTTPSPSLVPPTAAPRPTAAPTPVSTPSSAPSSSEFPEQTVRRLMQLGFGRDAVLQALRSCGGNEEFAASILFGGF